MVFPSCCRPPVFPSTCCGADTKTFIFCLRYYTVENLFSNLLLESAEDEVSFRTVVRDLQSQKPMLQLVLLSSKAWYFSGTCIENQAADPDCLVKLKPSVKVLFYDCSDASEADIRCAVFSICLVFLAFLCFCFWVFRFHLSSINNARGPKLSFY